MATDISVRTSATWGAEDRSFTIGEHGFDMTENAPLDFNLFSHANFAAEGVIKAGCVLGLVTATGKYGPYDNTATDGRETAVGMLFNTSRIPANKATVASDAILTHFLCRAARLPYPSGPGSLDSAGRADLRLVRFI